MDEIAENVGNDNLQDPAFLTDDQLSVDDPVSDAPFSIRSQKAVLDHLTTELDVAKRNNLKVNENFKTYYNMIHSVRNRKPNDWESDISLPEFLSRLLAQIGIFGTQYFSSTDYVEADLDSDDPKDVAESKAAKNLLNVILRDPDTFYYHKTIRLINFVFSCGYGIIKGGYKQKVNKIFSHMEQKSEIVVDPISGEYLAEDGTFYRDPMRQRVKFNTTESPVDRDEVEIDTPVFDVYPNQNVYQSPEYCYTLNDKEYIIFETEKTLSQLEAEKDQMGYFNLESLHDETPEGKRGEKTYNEDGTTIEQPQPPEKTFIEFERWGKYPAKEVDGKYVPAIDEQGKFKDDAELVECIIHYVQQRESDSPRHIIGFRKSPHTRRPMVKFLCYVDMVNDNGFGDGEVNRELQIAIDDNFNISSYRTTMAAMPSFKGKKFSGVPAKVKTGPSTVTMLENLGDLEQWIIDDDPQGSMIQHNLLASRMDYAMATSPQTMGMPSERAETATVGAITNQRANMRSGMKTMNLEFIGFNDFYRMLLTLCNDFMLPETLENLVGKELAAAYNPKRKDKFKPVSQALETEESKAYKLKTWQGILGMVGSIQNPKTPQVVNYIIGQMLETMGGQFNHFRKFMFEDDVETNLLYTLATGAKGGGSPPSGPNPMPPAQNQTGLPPGRTEQTVRGTMNG
jgi:hypothetical protein